MQFPLSRKNLQNISQDYYNSKRREAVDAVIEKMKDKILLKAYNDSVHQVVVCGRNEMWMKAFLDLKDYAHHFEGMRKFCLSHTYKDFIPQVLEGLQRKFPDTTFTVDPMKTYILADWSPDPILEAQKAIEKSQAVHCLWQAASQNLESRFKEAKTDVPSPESTTELIKNLNEALLKLQPSKPQNDDDELYS